MFLILSRALALISVLFILGVLLEKGINKLLGVEKKKVSETSGKKVDRWGRGIILILFLCTTSVLCILCDGRYHFYKVVLDTIFDCIIGFSVYFGVEIPEEFKTVCNYSYSSNNIRIYSL